MKPLALTMALAAPATLPDGKPMSSFLGVKGYAEKVFPAGILGDNGLNAIDSLFTEKKRRR